MARREKNIRGDKVVNSCSPLDLDQTFEGGAGYPSKNDLPSDFGRILEGEEVGSEEADLRLGEDTRIIDREKYQFVLEGREEKEE